MNKEEEIIQKCADYNISIYNFYDNPVVKLEDYKNIKSKLDKLEHQLQQYKQQIDELEKWLEEEISKCLEDSVSNRTKPNVRFWRLYDLREVLSKLKERDNNETNE